MTYEEYVKESAGAFLANPSWRLGQTLFNVLYDVRPGLAGLVRGTEFDPFYTDSNLPAFLTYIEERW